MKAQARRLAVRGRDTRVDHHRAPQPGRRQRGRRVGLALGVDGDKAGDGGARRRAREGRHLGEARRRQDGQPLHLGRGQALATFRHVLAEGAFFDLQLVGGCG
jgi:hypothetical protein